MIPVSTLKPIGSPFGRNGNYLVPRNLAKKSTLTCGDQHLSKPLMAENIMVPLQMTLTNTVGEVRMLINVLSCAYPACLHPNSCSKLVPKQFWFTNSSSELSIDSVIITDDKLPWSFWGSSSCLSHPADKTQTLSQVILQTDKCKFLSGMSWSW